MARTRAAVRRAGWRAARSDYVRKNENSFDAAVSGMWGMCAGIKGRALQRNAGEFLESKKHYRNWGRAFSEWGGCHVPLRVYLTERIKHRFGHAAYRLQDRIEGFVFNLSMLGKEYK